MAQPIPVATFLIKQLDIKKGWLVRFETEIRMKGFAAIHVLTTPTTTKKTKEKRISKSDLYVQREGYRLLACLSGWLALFIMYHCYG